MRTAEEVMMRYKLILDQPDIVLLVDKSSSPTAAYDMVMDSANNDETAKAARCHVQRNTARKGEKDEAI